MSEELADLRQALQTYCRGRFLGMSGRVVELERISDGWENDVYTFALEGGAEASRSELILRMYPGEGAEATSSREYRVLRWLQEASYPVPRVLAFEASDSPLGKPFVIMQKIDGRVLGPMMGEATGERREALVGLLCRLLVQLHTLDWHTFVPDPSAYEAPGFIGRWLGQVRTVLGRFPGSGFEEAFGWIEEQAAGVGEARLALAHWDFHPHNILLRGDGAPFVIDWTSAEVTDYRFDLAWTLLLMGSYQGAAMRGAVLSGYEQAAGRRVEHLEFFEAFASLRRLFSIVVSLSLGPEKLGMRPGAERQIGDARHIERVYALLQRTTGLTVAPVEALLARL